MGGVLPDGMSWTAPEAAYQARIENCKGIHSDGSGFDSQLPGRTFGDDELYTDCLQRAYDQCVMKEPATDSCREAELQGDDPTIELLCKKTCFAHKQDYLDAAETCFSDDRLIGFQACLNEAEHLYNLESEERARICEKTLVIQRAALPCLEGFGYVSCCCIVKGMMITHPPRTEDPEEVATDACGENTWFDQYTGTCKSSCDQKSEDKKCDCDDDKNDSSEEEEEGDCEDMSHLPSETGCGLIDSTPKKGTAFEEVKLESACDCQAYCSLFDESSAFEYLPHRKGKCVCYKGNKIQILPGSSIVGWTLRAES